MAADHNNNNRDKWYHRAVVYHIYCRSFKDSNNDGVGDIPGVIEKLDYLNDGTEKSLGIGAIWISPIYRSPMADFGYDIADYNNIDPTYGNLEDFDRLVKDCHRRNIRVIIDFVINHTSWEHPWFKESRSVRQNPKRDWYIWQDPKPDGSPPNNWLSVFGGPAWNYDLVSGQYYFHSFLPQQPDLNWHNPEVREEMMKVARFWLERGVDGFRIDAVEHLLEDSYLRDDPKNPDYNPDRDDPYRANEHLFSKSQKDLSHCINSLCNVIGGYQDKFIISEAYVDIPKIMSLYRACVENQIHAPFNFNLMQLPWKAGAYKKFVDDFEKALLPIDWPNYVFGNHDRPRLVSRLGRHGEQKARTVAVLLLTLRGLPFIYYGDELGMKNVRIAASQVKDPFARRSGLARLSRDPARTPMQWSAESFAGFSKVKPWLPVSPDYREKNLETERRDPDSIFNLYRRLIHFRNRTAALQVGRYQPLSSKSRQVFSFLRIQNNQKILVLLNFSRGPVEELLPSSPAEVVCSTHHSLRPAGQKFYGTLRLEPYEGCVLKI